MPLSIVHRQEQTEIGYLPSTQAFALTGRACRMAFPRAMPWAMCSLPLRGAIGYMRIIIRLFGSARICVGK